MARSLDTVEAGARIRNMLALRHSTRTLARHAASLEAEVRRATEAITAREHEVILRLARASERPYKSEWPVALATERRYSA